jgi:leucyl aminopeptidase
MIFAVSSENSLTLSTACLVVGIFKDGELEGTPAAVDKASNGGLSRLIESADLSPRLGRATFWPALDGMAAERLLVVGLGKRGNYNESALQRATVAATRALSDRNISEAVTTLMESELGERDMAWRVRQVALHSEFAIYRYTATRKPRDDENQSLEQLTFSGIAADLEHPLAEASAIAAGVKRARELGNLPPNICTPAYLADQALEIADIDERASCEILETAAMEELGMGALLGVARGSRNDPRLIVLRYAGAENADDEPYAMVGKGITFDTGGISLKPGKGMEEMKYDMGGAAGVMGAFEACVRMGLPLNLITVVPAVENMPDGDAYRPGDVVTSMSGKTIEVLNTDAEGRMILCDALTYVQQFKPRTIIDAATLTGACVVALGKIATGLMTEDDDLADDLISAGINTHDRAWRLPIWNDYQPLIDTPYADMQNIGGPTAGSITAGCFLARFTKGTRWAHLDIAGTAWDGGTKNGATGRPVGLLAQYLIDRSQDDD